MRGVHSIPALQPFNPSGYEILDGELATHGDVVIWSTASFVPALGDTFTVESEGHVHDVAVCEVVNFDGGGWSARCRVQGWV
jgi:hypothetical protein